MLEVDNLACVRGDHTLFTGLSFTLAAGELLQVQGENGSGKTSLLRTVCGLMQPAEGEIRWNGKKVKEIGSEFNAAMMYLGHHNAVKDELNAVENLCISSGLAGFEISETEAVKILQRMGLRRKVHLPVKVLSQGQRRRVALSRLLASEASLWVLDEPLTALDVGAVDMMQELIAEHLSKAGMVIFTTHQPLLVPGVQLRQLALS